MLPVTSRAAELDFSKAETLVNQAIQRGEAPGAVLLVGRRSGVVYQKAFGNRAVRPANEAMTVDTVFDLASLSKPVGTATSIMILVDRTLIDPKEKVAKYLPAFGNNGKEKITVEHLLLHRGGLIPDNTIKDYADGPAKAWERVCQLDVKSEPGTKFAYSDVGFIVLGKLVEAVDPKHRTLDRFAAEEVFGPLSMRETAYNPPAEWKSRVAPTEQREGRFMRGEVHDPRAYAMGGVAGHAGVFSTAQDLARYCRMLLNGGELDGVRILSPRGIELMSTGVPLADGTQFRSYGFDVKTGYSQPLGERFTPIKSFGHTGFTGTCFWVSPADDAFFILLTNSVHPDGKGKVLALRRAVSTAVAEALLGPKREGEAPSEPRADSNTQGIDRLDRQRIIELRFGVGRPDGVPIAALNVLTGLDVLKEDDFKALAGRKVGIVTNHTGRDRDGNHIVDLLTKAPGVKVVCLFSPEHGLYGKMDEKVGHGTDPKTGLKVWSLYGETRKPTAQMLEGVDTLVFDIQDVGARFYTYVSTMGLCMEAAAANKVRMVVLDRPNPIGGTRVDGPVADKKYFGFTAYGAIPVVHGMTVGELARLFNTDFQINCDLQVIECRNYDRRMWFDETGLMWTNPSPNMRNLTQATIYPAICLLEATNVSVGRGTDQPFEFFGAPWIDGKKLAAALNADRANFPGLRFVPIEFTPTASKHKDKACQGCYVIVTDRGALEPARSGTAIAWHLRRLFGDAFQVDAVARLLHDDAAVAAIKTADDPAKIPDAWRRELEEFRATREKYLIYK
jgi:uncharacterized protein YbbC (DUF1343 family)/CubicO group peptidase (beta-lactamase class C family)